MSRKFLTPLVLPADPTAALEAATKQYVDGKVVGGGTSEVEIQATDPIGTNPSAELWYDTAGVPSAGATAWATPTLTNSWVPWSSGAWGAPQYRKVGDVVQLRGMAASGTLTVPMFTLPVGFRPPGPFVSSFAVVTADIFGQVRIDTAGQVNVMNGSTTWVSLAGLSFSVTP